jgi:hypothetical protein
MIAASRNPRLELFLGTPFLRTLFVTPPIN